MRRLIGELAVKRCKLSIAQVFRVLEHQAANGGKFRGNCKNLLGCELALSLPFSITSLAFMHGNPVVVIDDLTLISEHGSLRETLGEK